MRRHVILKRGRFVRFSRRDESAGYSFLHALVPRCSLSEDSRRAAGPGLHGLLGQAEERLYAADPKRVAGATGGTLRAGRRPCAGHSLPAHGGRKERRPAIRTRRRRGTWSEHSGWWNGLQAPRTSACRMDLLEQRALMRLRLRHVRRRRRFPGPGGTGPAGGRRESSGPGAARKRSTHAVRGLPARAPRSSMKHRRQRAARLIPPSVPLWTPIARLPGCTCSAGARNSPTSWSGPCPS